MTIDGITVFSPRMRGWAMAVAFFVLLGFVRQLFLLFACLVLFQRLFAWLGSYLHRHSRLPFNAAVMIVAVVFLTLLIAADYWLFEVLWRHLEQLKMSVLSLIDIVETSAFFQHYFHNTVESGFGSFTAEIKNHALEVFHYAQSIGRGVVYLVIAFILSIVFLLEKDELVLWQARQDANGLIQSWCQFLRFLADAVVVTVRLQITVAVVNTTLTLPILLFLHLPGISALLVLLFISSLVPVVGAVVAGAVIMTIALVTKGLWGLILFIVWTFILHKIESYFLIPRLAARHVALPSFVIIVSLLLFEHLFGILGLFMSFPCLYTLVKINEKIENSMQLV